MSKEVGRTNLSGLDVRNSKLFGWITKMRKCLWGHMANMNSLNTKKIYSWRISTINFRKKNLYLQPLNYSFTRVSLRLFKSVLQSGAKMTLKSTLVTGMKNSVQDSWTMINTIQMKIGLILMKVIRTVNLDGLVKTQHWITLYIFRKMFKITANHISWPRLRSKILSNSPIIFVNISGNSKSQILNKMMKIFQSWYFYLVGKSVAQHKHGGSVMTLWPSTWLHWMIRIQLDGF